MVALAKKWGVFEDIGLNTDLPTDGNNYPRTLALKDYILDVVDTDLPVVDVGCNCGYFLRELAKAGCKDLTGIDARAEHLDFVRAWSDIDGVDVRLIEQDAQSLKPELFNGATVLVLGLLQHLSDPFALLNAIADSKFRAMIIESYVWDVERFEPETRAGNPVYGLGGGMWYLTKGALERELRNRGLNAITNTDWPFSNRAIWRVDK